MGSSTHITGASPLSRQPAWVKLLPTFRGWLLRQGAKLAAAGAAFATGWISGKAATAIEWCKANGASEETIQQVQETFTSIAGTSGLAITTLVFFIVEMTLSRIAAKYPEQKKD